MDEKKRETTYIFVQIKNCQRQVNGKLGDMAKIHICRLPQTRLLISLIST